MLLQGISHAIKFVAINSNFKIFAGASPPDSQMKLASLAPGPPIRNPGYAPGVSPTLIFPFWFISKVSRLYERYTHTQQVRYPALNVATRKMMSYSHSTQNLQNT